MIKKSKKFFAPDPRYNCFQNAPAIRPQEVHFVNDYKRHHPDVASAPPVAGHPVPFLRCRYQYFGFVQLRSFRRSVSREHSHVDV